MTVGPTLQKGTQAQRSQVTSLRPHSQQTTTGFRPLVSRALGCMAGAGCRGLTCMTWSCRVGSKSSSRSRSSKPSVSLPVTCRSLSSLARISFLFRFFSCLSSSRFLAFSYREQAGVRGQAWALPADGQASSPLPPRGPSSCAPESPPSSPSCAPPCGAPRTRCFEGRS